MKAPPPKVARPTMDHRWSWITFIHWRYPPSLLEQMLPPGLTVGAFDGSAWVGLTPFLMQGVQAPALSAVPCLSSFPEINVRTYVQGPRGRRGTWFLSLDAARLPAVLATRVGYRLPYYWSNMAARIDGDQIAIAVPAAGRALDGCAVPQYRTQQTDGCGIGAAGEEVSWLAAIRVECQQALRLHDGD